MSTLHGEVIECQLDWLTGAVHTGHGTARLVRWARKLAEAEETRESRIVPFRLCGYEGWHCGRISIGTRQAAGLLQLSGDLARLHFDTLMGWLDNVSRLDLAVTVRLHPADRGPGWRHYNEALNWYQSHPKAARPSYHGDGDGGMTAYLGHRESDRYLRIYDKEMESGGDALQREHYAGCWRYELETKGQTASAVAAEVYARGPDERVSLIRSIVHTYCANHGIQPAFPAMGPASLVPGFRRRSDRQSRLTWLEKTVRPVVEWLGQTGDGEQALRALGLVPPNDAEIELRKSNLSHGGTNVDSSSL